MLNYECFECAWKGKPPNTLAYGLLKVQQPWGGFAMTFAHLCLEELWSGITNWYDILSRGFLSARLPGNAFLFFFLSRCMSFEAFWSRQYDFLEAKGNIHDFCLTDLKNKMQENISKRWNSMENTFLVYLWVEQLQTAQFRHPHWQLARRCIDSSTSDFFIGHKLDGKCFS